MAHWWLAITQRTFVLMKTSSKSLEDVFRLGLQKTSSRRLDQDENVCPSLTSSEDEFKTSSNVLVKTNILALAMRLQDVFQRRLQNVFKTSTRRLQDVFKTSSRLLAQTSWRHLQNVFKTSSRPLQDVLKTSSRHLQHVLQRHLRDIFKVYHQVNLF